MKNEMTTLMVVYECANSHRRSFSSVSKLGKKKCGKCGMPLKRKIMSVN